MNIKFTGGSGKLPKQSRKIQETWKERLNCTDKGKTLRK